MNFIYIPFKNQNIIHIQTCIKIIVLYVLKWCTYDIYDMKWFKSIIHEMKLYLNNNFTYDISTLRKVNDVSTPLLFYKLKKMRKTNNYWWVKPNSTLAILWFWHCVTDEKINLIGLYRLVSRVVYCLHLLIMYKLLL